MTGFYIFDIMHMFKVNIRLLLPQCTCLLQLVSLLRDQLNEMQRLGLLLQDHKIVLTDLTEKCSRYAYRAWHVSLQLMKSYSERKFWLNLQVLHALKLMDDHGSRSD